MYQAADKALYVDKRRRHAAKKRLEAREKPQAS
jgi:hypothetical protein